MQIYKTHDLLGPLLTQIWPITHLASHLTPRVTCWDFHIWGKLTDISHTLNRVPTSVHTLPSHEHLGNHPEDWFPSITSRIVTLPSSILHPASSGVLAFHWTSRSAGLRLASDHRGTDVTAASTGDGRSPSGFVSHGSQVRSGPIAGHAIHHGHYARHVSAAGKGLARCSSISAATRSPVPMDMGQDALWHPSPAGDQEALRDVPKTRSKRARECSRSQSRSGEPSPSERRDGQSHGYCRHSLSSRDTPYRPACGHLLPSSIESVVGVWDIIIPALWLEAGAHCHLVTTGPAPAPRPASADPTHQRLNVGLQAGDVVRHLRPDGPPLSDTTTPTSQDAPPLDTAALVGPLLTAPDLVLGRVAIRIKAWTVHNLRLLRPNACCSSVQYLHVIPSTMTMRRIPRLS